MFVNEMYKAIKEHMVEAGIKSDAELCRRVGIKPTTFNSFKNNDNAKLGFDVILKIAYVLGVPMEELLPPSESLSSEENESFEQSLVIHVPVGSETELTSKLSNLKIPNSGQACRGGYILAELGGGTTDITEENCSDAVDAKVQSIFDKRMLLFDRTSKLSESDIDIVVALVDRLVGDNE